MMNPKMKALKAKLPSSLNRESDKHLARAVIPCLALPDDMNSQVNLDLVTTFI